MDQVDTPAKPPILTCRAVSSACWIETSENQSGLQPIAMPQTIWNEKDSTFHISHNQRENMIELVNLRFPEIAVNREHVPVIFISVPFPEGLPSLTARQSHLDAHGTGSHSPNTEDHT